MSASSNPQPFPDLVKELVERFERGRFNYAAPGYNETQVRREFIDPMFTALGWDVDNKAGYAEAYKDVIHEDRVVIGGRSKAPDYSFRIGGNRKFFVEAKKPSVNLQSDPTPAYQLRRYAWNAKLPLSVLTDFDEFAVYDCRHEPQVRDPASQHRLLYVKSEEYEARWGEIAEIFSKDAVLLGSFDRYAVSLKGKRGTTEVDAVFLGEMEDWRKLLARNLTLRNTLTQEELNYSVQQIIDRIVFLRICEDRGIEPYGQLEGLTKHADVYTELVKVFQRADERFNSGLFHFKSEAHSDAPDRLTPALSLDSSILKQIIKRLYYPASQFDFKVFPADILGQVYERFLGQVIRLTPSGRAVIEPKPDVRKAGGVYYTPTYIVQYIVERTLGAALDGLNPASASKVRVLDPACGSGSFLLVAYDFLLRWHLAIYEHSKSAMYRNRIYAGAGGRYMLTIEEKRRILLNNVFGVDIDAQAVEVTKLSLLLKVLEDESAESLAQQLRLFNERALPNLHENIKCGNSLIGPDYFRDEPLDPTERIRINPFSWDDEFPEAVAAGGFDVVIGNPPYVFTREQFTAHERAYYSSEYPCGWEKRNTFLLFMELLPRLLKESGKGGYIVPNSWLTVESAKRVRSIYAERLLEIADLNYSVFDGAVVEPTVFIVDGKDVPDAPLVRRVASRAEFAAGTPVPIERALWERSAGRFVIPGSDRETVVVDGILERASSVGATFDVRTGLQAYEVGKGSPKQTKHDVANHVYDRDGWENDDSYPYLQGRDVRRYRLDWSGSWMQHGPWLSQPREIEMFQRPRVLVREITSPYPHCFCAAFTEQPFLSNKSVLTVLDPEDDVARLEALEVVLNSRLMSLCYKARSVKGARKVFPKIVVKNFRELPFPRVIDPRQAADAVVLARRLKEAAASASEARMPRQHEALMREVARLERDLEVRVCRLFGLDDNLASSVMDLTMP